MNIGVFGGSFDPIHIGHAVLANFISQCNLVDAVLLTVSRQNPLKEHPVFANDIQRLEMAELVASKCRNVTVSDIEIKLPFPSYSYDTLCALKNVNPEHDFRLIIGSDSLENFPRWKNSEKIIKDFGLLVYPRRDYPLPEKEPENVIFLTGAPLMGISSSLVREYIKSGWDINYFVPVEVAEYINKNKLYR